MNIIFINSSDVFEKRIDLIYEALKKYNHNIKVVTSDYMHIEKKKRFCEKKDYFYISTIPYKRNISLRRLYSHYKFSKDAYRYIKNEKIDLLYIVIPPNSQAKIVKKYKKKNPNVKVIIDIIDLWPESMPIRGTSIFPFSLWANIRNNALKNADLVITECDLYQEKLKKYLKKLKVKTIYWAKKSDDVEIQPILNNDEVNLCYLGSINNIIDIQKIGDIIQKISQIKPVVLKVIGAGEKTNELLAIAEKSGAEVVYYGKIYNSLEKQKIFNTCHYGLNIMKQNVNVGLSMKSIDYFQAGLPLINNLSGDTAKFISVNKMGINWTDEEDMSQLNLDNNISQRLAIHDFFLENFTYEVFCKNMLASINELLNIFEEVK